MKFIQNIKSCTSTYKLLFALFLMTFTSPRAALSASMLDVWANFLEMPNGTLAIHDLTAFTDPADGALKLAIAMGFEQGAPILFWDPSRNELSTAFTAPLNTYSTSPYWRSLQTFNGKLYAGLGTPENSPPTGPLNTAQVWQYDGTSWVSVLSTSLGNTYTLGVYNNQLYAGLGTFGSNAGQLWVTSDGLHWTMLKQFSSSFVRTLAVFQNDLYIGLRDNADVWKYDGTTFTHIGPPTRLTLQVKTLVPSPDGSFLYVGGVPAYIYTWDGSSYSLSLDARATDSEIYKGEVYQGDVFFPTHAKANGGQSGNIYRFDNGSWNLDYSTPVGLAQLQVVYPFDGFIYTGGDGSPPELLQALYSASATPTPSVTPSSTPSLTPTGTPTATSTRTTTPTRTPRPTRTPTPTRTPSATSTNANRLIAWQSDLLSGLGLRAQPPDSPRRLSQFCLSCGALFILPRLTIAIAKAWTPTIPFDTLRCSAGPGKVSADARERK